MGEKKKKKMSLGLLTYENRAYTHASWSSQIGLVPPCWLTSAWTRSLLLTPSAQLLP